MFVKTYLTISKHYVGMTKLIESSDPQYFTLSSDELYDRHHYKIIDKFGDSIIVKSWMEVQEIWWNKKKFLSHIEVLDTNVKKGFA